MIDETVDCSKWQRAGCSGAAVSTHPGRRRMGIRTASSADPVTPAAELDVRRAAVGSGHAERIWPVPGEHDARWRGRPGRGGVRASHPLGTTGDRGDGWWDREGAGACWRRGCVGVRRAGPGRGLLVVARAAGVGAVGRVTLTRSAAVSSPRLVQTLSAGRPRPSGGWLQADSAGTSTTRTAVR